ncbi:MAG: hypothetical protein MJ033_03115 [Victivallaceae bacterium]|nr:hypothetical protein [Victivallaceae bacterium]
MKNPEKVVTPLTLPIRTAPDKVQEARTGQLRDLMRDFPTRGVWLYIGAYDKVLSLETVLDYIEDFHFNHIYCVITSESEVDEDLEALLLAAARRNLKVDIVMDIFSFFPRKSGNRILRFLRKKTPSIPEMIERLVQLHKENPAYRNLAGITVVCNIHRFNRDNIDHPADSFFIWSEHTFGPGLDNDMMMKIVLKGIHELPALPDDMKLTLAVPDFFNEYVKEGKLSCGSVSDFAATRVPQPDIIVISHGNKATEAAKRLSDELADPRIRPGSVSVLLAIANHTSVGNDQMRRRNWKDFINFSGYLKKQCDGQRNFGGMIIGPFVLVKSLQLEP